MNNLKPAPGTYISTREQLALYSGKEVPLWGTEVNTKRDVVPIQILEMRSLGFKCQYSIRKDEHNKPIPWRENVILNDCAYADWGLDEHSEFPPGIYLFPLYWMAWAYKLKVRQELELEAA